MTPKRLAQLFMDQQVERIRHTYVTIRVPSLRVKHLTAKQIQRIDKRETRDRGETWRWR